MVAGLDDAALSITRIRSARFTVDRRWAMTTRVQASAVQRLLHLALGGGVQGAGGLVQQQHRRAADQRPGQGQPLALPARDGAAPIGQRRVVAQRQGDDVVVDGGQAGGPLDRRPAAGRGRPGDVVADAEPEQAPGSGSPRPNCRRTERRSSSRASRAVVQHPARAGRAPGPGSGWPAWSCPSPSARRWPRTAPA